MVVWMRDFEMFMLCMLSRDSNTYVGLVFWRASSPLAMLLRFGNMSWR